MISAPLPIGVHPRPLFEIVDNVTAFLFVWGPGFFVAASRRSSSSAPPAS
jgi:hypothetical protein